MRTTRLAAIVLLLGLGGCSDEPPTVTPLSEEELAKIPALTPTQLKALLDGQKGKVVALAVWSVRREACVAMYPKLGALRRGGGASEPVVVAVNIDRVDDVRAKVLPLLEKHQPKFLNRVVRGGPDALAAFVGENWSGQVPAIALYGRDGQRAATFTGKDALVNAQERLNELLAEP